MIITLVDYMKIVQEVENDLHPKLLLLGNLSVFANEKELFAQVSPFMKVHHYQKGQIIIEEGDAMEKMYWVIAGNCSVSKIVPFVSISAPGTNISLRLKFDI
jgi:CRP-like cAMP-binding protein